MSHTQSTSGRGEKWAAIHIDPTCQGICIEACRYPWDLRNISQDLESWKAGMSKRMRRHWWKGSASLRQQGQGCHRWTGKTICAWQAPYSAVKKKRKRKRKDGKRTHGLHLAQPLVSKLKSEVNAKAKDPRWLSGSS